jgi:hypothetical protein
MDLFKDHRRINFMAVEPLTGAKEILESKGTFPIEAMKMYFPCLHPVGT